MSYSVEDIAKEQLADINESRLRSFKQAVRFQIDRLGQIAHDIKNLEKQIEAKKLQAVQVKEEMKALKFEEIDASILA